MLIKYKERILSRAIATAVICAFLFNDIAFAIDLPRSAENSTLATTSIFNPIAVAVWDEAVQKYRIIENETNTTNIMTGRRELAAIVYADILTRQVLKNLNVLAKEGMSHDGVIKRIDKFKESLLALKTTSKIDLTALKIEEFSITGDIVSLSTNNPAIGTLQYNLDGTRINKKKSKPVAAIAIRKASDVIPAVRTTDDKSPQGPPGDNLLDVKSYKTPERIVESNNGGALEKARRFKKLASELEQERNRVFEIHSRWKPAIAFFGSVRISKKNRYYKKGIKLGAAAFKMGYVIITGGGPSMSEAPARGFIEERQKAGVKKSPDNYTRGGRITLPFEQATNPYIEDNHTFQHFIIRKAFMYKNSLGTIVQPGGFGTKDELFEAWVRKQPVVLFGKRYWKPIIKVFYKSWGQIGAAKRARNILITDSIKEAMQYLKLHQRPVLLDSKEKVADANREIKEGLSILSQWDESVTFIGEPKDKSKEINTSQNLASRVMSTGTPVRVGSRGILLDSMLECARTMDKKEMLQATLFNADGSDLSANEKEIKKSIVASHATNYQVMITENSKAFVFLPGDIKTMARLFDILEVFHTGKIEPKPIILIGRQFWQPIMKAIINAAKSFKPHLSDKKEIRFLKIVDTAEEALRYINEKKDHPVPEESKLLPTPYTERKPAVDFRDAIIERGKQAEKEGQKTIIVLGTGLIPGYNGSDKALQYKDLNNLIVAMRQHCEDKGICFIDKEDSQLSEAIKTARAKDGYENAKVIVLAKEETLLNALNELKGDKDVFMAGVDNHNINTDCYIRIMEMIRLTMELSAQADPNNPPPSPNIPITYRNGFWIFIPRAERMNYDALRAIYEVQKSA